MNKTQLKKNTEYTFNLTDQVTNEKIELKVQPVSNTLLMIGAKGYGECLAEDGSGYPIVIEPFNGTLRIMIWSDINDEDPTHVINMKEALESERYFYDD